MRAPNTLQRIALLAALLLGLSACGTHAVEGRPTIDTLRARAAARPDDPRAQTDLAMAELLADDGDATRAEAAIGNALRVSPEDERVHLLRGLERYQHGAPVAAMEAFLDALDRAARSRRPDAPYVAEVAAGGLEEVSQLAPGFFEVAPPRLAALLASPGRIGPAAAHTVGDIVAEAHYRAGDPEAAREVAHSLGCITTWRVAGPFGPRDLLGFDERHLPLNAGSFRSEYDLGPLRGTQPTRDVESRGCSTHLGGGTVVSGGTTYAMGTFRVERDGEHVLRLETPNAVEVYFDDRREAAVHLDLRREPVPRVTFHRVSLLEGVHTVKVKVTTRHPNPILMLSFLPDEPGWDGELPTGEDWLGDYLAVVLRTARGDAVEARAVLDAMEGGTSAALLGLRAAVAMNDPNRPADQRRDEARRRFSQMAAADPGAFYPALHLARLAAADGRDDAAIAALRESADRWPEIVAFPMTLVELTFGRGWDAEAARWVARAREVQPDGCAPLLAAMDVARQRDHTAEATELAERSVACDARSQARFQLLVAARRWDEATRELDRLASLEPAPARWMLETTRADIARGRGDMEALDRHLAAFLAEQPRSDVARLAQADRLLAQGQRDEAVALLDRALLEEPASMNVLRPVRRALGAAHVLEPYRLDGAAVLRDFEASGRTYTEPQVLVLDYTVVRVFQDLSSVELTHNIFKIQSEEAVDEHGEFAPPADAELLTLHTIKADGTRLEPDLLPGKDSISMPSLAVGDYVEFEYVRYVDPPAGMPGGILGDRFYFRSFEVPFDRTQLTVVVPDSVGPVVVDPRGPAPETREQREEYARVYSWRFDESRPLVREPGSVDPREYLPSINWGVRVPWQSLVDGLRDILADRDPRDPAAEGIVRRVLSRAHGASDAERARRLYDWVLGETENNDDVFGLAPAMLADRNGNRARMLHYLYGLAGLESQLVMVRSYGFDQVRSELADEETYGHLLVRVRLDGEWTYLHTNARGTPFGYVPPTLRGMDALVLAPEVGVVELPGATGEEDLRDITATVRVEAGGAARFETVETHHGLGAIQWREDLEGIPQAQLEPQFEEAYVARLVPGARLARLAIEGQRDRDADLALVYDFDVPAVGRRESGTVVVPGLFPSQLSANYARLPSRTTAQLIAAPIAMDVTLRFTAADGGRLPEPPRDVTLEGPNGARFTLEARREGEALVLTRRLRVPRMRIAPGDYAAWATFCRRVDEAEQRELRVRM